MATKLLKSVSRQTLSIEGKKKKPIIVTLIPGDVISFRVKGSKTSNEIYLGHCYVLAQIINIEKFYKQRVEKYNQRKKEGAKGLKKPRKPFLPFSRMYFDAIK